MRPLTILACATGLLFGVLPCAAQTAGVTAAVDQSARGTPPGGPVRTISLGDEVVSDERISTDEVGRVQILLRDGTTFTVGPRSTLTIDRFVYDPDAGTAEVAAEAAQGVFRFIGGLTSKTGGAAVRTPVGTVGIRGGMVDILLGQRGGFSAVISMLYGDEVTLTRPGSRGVRVYRPGYSIFIGPDGQASIRKTPARWANAARQAFSGAPGSQGASPEPGSRRVEESEVARSNSQLPEQNFDPGWETVSDLPITETADTPIEVSTEAEVYAPDSPVAGTTAIYSGTASGTVSSSDGGETWTSAATGSLQMGWDFGAREGDILIEDFDGLTFGGTLEEAPGPNAGFQGNISEIEGGGSGQASGNFFDVDGATAGGVTGGFGFQGYGGALNAQGTFTGRR